MTANLWMDGLGDDGMAAPLEGHVTADVAVIGAGFTGCSAALHLAQAGVNVRLLEARSIGFGASGRNVGLVNAGLWLSPERVEETLGQEIGLRLNTLLADGPRLVFSLVDQHAITCGDTRNGTLHCAHSHSGLGTIRDRFRQYRDRGWPVELLSPDDTAIRTGATIYHGALLDRRAGTLNPLAYVRGLAKAAISAGARLHESTPAIGLKREGAGWRIVTEKGSISSQALLLATNAYQEFLPTQFQPSISVVRYFQIATQPLPTKLRNRILPEGQGAWDTAPIMSSFRMDARGRLILGGIGSLQSAGANIHRNWARRKMRTLFPEAASQEFRFSWEGRIAMTRDFLPKVGRHGDRALSIFGYNGRGIGPGTIFGRAAANFLMSNDESEIPLSIQGERREKLNGIRAAAIGAGALAVHFTADRNC